MRSASIGKRMSQGAGIALILIITFLIDAGEPNPEWPKLWVIKPLFIVSLAGAIGGGFYYCLEQLRYQGGWRQPLVIVLGLLGYILILWLGAVLGLNGTMWN